MTAWPPHEDETLALFVGRESLRDLLVTVHGERGGAPLHFLLAWGVERLGGGLTGLRSLSAAWAVASVPLIAVLGRRLAGRSAGLAAAIIASASWMLLFHGVYARMYSVFLLTSLVSYVALLGAVERGGARRWVVWGIASIAAVAAHPYGALLLAAQGAWVLTTRTRVREAIAAFAVVGVVCAPFWYTDLVLARRFDVGVGAGGEKLSGPLDILRYLVTAAGDFTAGWRAAVAGSVVLAVVGWTRLWRTRREAALLALAGFAVPAAAFLAARFGSATAPESRHLIFAFPLFAVLVGAGAHAFRRAGPVALAALVATQLAWAYHRTPQLFTGEPSAREAARAAAAAWLARTGRPDDVLFGYDPLFLGAWERNRNTSLTVVPRADPTLALDALREAPALGRGVWVFDASDTNNFDPKPTIAPRVPVPRNAFEAHAFGPFLVVRSRRPTRTAARFLEEASSVMITGKSLFIGDADVNFVTVRKAADQLSRESGRSPSASSR